MNEELKTKVKFDGGGYACAGGDVIQRNGYVWFGNDTSCFSHTTSLRSLRGLRDLCDKLIAARTAPPKKRAKKRS